MAVLEREPRMPRRLQVGDQSVPGPLQRVHPRRRGQVEVQQPGECQLPLHRGLFVPFGARTRVEAHQVVVAVAARGGRLQEAGVDQRLQEVLRRAGVQVQERGGRREGDVRAVRQAQEAEGTGLGRFQLAVAELERGLHREVARLEFVQAAAFVGELRGQHRHRPGPAGGQPGRGDADGQREEAARGHDVQGRLALRADAFVADDAGEELQGLLGGHHVQVHEVRAGQVDHADPAGDQGRAALRAGQQGPDLGRVMGVVEQDEDAAPVEGGTVERGPLVQGVRDRGVRGAQRAQERAEDGLGFGGRGARPLEVHVQLAVREVRTCPVGDVDREGRLADAADAGQRGDRHDGPLGSHQPVAQLAYERGAPREVRDGGGELGRADRDGGRGRFVGRAGQLLVRPQDPLLELGQFGAGVDAQFLGEQPARVGVHRECLRLPAAAVEGDHQQFAQALAQRLRGGERGQLGNRLRVAAELQVEVEPGLGELEAPLLQAGALVLGVRAGE